MGQLVKLGNKVDTLKIQFYPNGNTSKTELESFNNQIDSLIEKKQLAQEIKSHDKMKRYVDTFINDTRYKLMAQSKPGFNIALINGDIDISLVKFSPNSNNPIIKVEFRSEFLCRHGYKEAINLVKNVIDTFLTTYLIKVSELHLCTDIQGYEFTELDFHRMGTFAKRKAIYNANTMDRHHYGAKFTGFSLGKGDEMLRIYNKTVEISQNRKKGFIEVLSWDRNPNYNPMKTVWRIEFQIRRARLKTLLGNNGLLDTLDNVINALNDIWAYFVNRYVHKNFSNSRIFEKMQGFKQNENGDIKILSADAIRKRFQRAETSNVWDFISTFEDVSHTKLVKFKEVTKPEKIYVKNAYKALISTYIKLNRGIFNSEELTRIILEADRELKEAKDISIIDNARVKTLDYIKTAEDYYFKTGLDICDYKSFQKDLYINLHDTFAIFEDNPSNLTTFKQFQKRIS